MAKQFHDRSSPAYHTPLPITARAIIVITCRLRQNRSCRVELTAMMASNKFQPSPSPAISNHSESHFDTSMYKSNPPAPALPHTSHPRMA